MAIGFTTTMTGAVCSATSTTPYTLIPQQRAWINADGTVVYPDAAYDNGLPPMLVVREYQMLPTPAKEGHSILITAIPGTYYFGRDDKSSYYRADTVHEMQNYENARRDILERKITALEAQLKDAAEELQY